MRIKFYEFIVKGVVAGDPDRLHVIGRCGDLPIRIGDHFDLVFQYRARKYPEEAGRRPVRSVEEPVDLTVLCVHAYQRSLPELGEGMTGSLVLEGAGADKVIPGWILGQTVGETPRTSRLVRSTDQSAGV